MNPIYFPYTYISSEVAEAVAACLGRFTVYQPLSDQLPPSMQALMEEGIMDIRIPVEGGSRELISAAGNYLDWANTHAEGTGRKLASLKTLLAAAPLPDDTLSSEIVADVKNRISADANDKSSNPVLAARIFLYFAQQFDQQSRELDLEMTEFSRKEQALIRDLKMEDDALAAEFIKGSSPGPDGSADYLIPGRLEAWTRILLRDKEPSALFVTHSVAVLEPLLDSAPAAKKILDVKAIPRSAPAATVLASWQEQLLSYLYDIAENNPAPDFEKKADEFHIPVSANAVSLKCFLIPDQNAREIFCHATGIEDSDHDHLPPVASFRNTLLALVGL